MKVVEVDVVHASVTVADGDFCVWVDLEYSFDGGVDVLCHEFSSLFVVVLCAGDHGAVDDSAYSFHVY